MRHARDAGKPILFFVREPAIRDYESLRADSSYRTKWVEPTKDDARKKWLDFMKWASELPKHEHWSNWYDSFKTVVDLKLLVRKRLSDHFPNQLGAVALHPDRVLRVVFIRGASSAHEVHGHFRNVGPGPAFNLQHGSQVGATEINRAHRGGLADAEDLLARGEQECMYSAPVPGPDDTQERAIFCEYENRFGDGYRVEVPLLRPDLRGVWHFQPERFLVRAGDGKWIEVGAGRA